MTFRIAMLDGEDGGPALAGGRRPGQPLVEASHVMISGKRKNFLSRVTGEVANRGPRPVVELELLVHYMDSGRPLFRDEKDRPTWSVVYPALPNSVRDPDARRPLGPGEARAFSVDVPEPYAWTEEPDRVGAQVSGIRFAR